MGASLSNWQQTADLLFCHGTQQDLSPKYDITGVVAFSLHAFTADCSSIIIREGEEHTIECRIENCSVPVSQDNVVWCLNYWCTISEECDSLNSLCVNSTGITNIVGEAPAVAVRNNIEVTNSGGLHIAHVLHELRNTTYNCSVVDREGIVCGPQSYTFTFNSPGKLMYVCLFFLFFFFCLCLWFGKILLHIQTVSGNTLSNNMPCFVCLFVCLFCFCSYFFPSHPSTTTQNRVHFSCNCARRCCAGS